jgi:hypothetical protein
VVLGIEAADRRGDIDVDVANRARHRFTAERGIPVSELEPLTGPG